MGGNVRRTKPKLAPPDEVEAPDEGALAIDLGLFDDEEYEALVTGEWGVGWRMNQTAINRREVLAHSLGEFLGRAEAESV